MYTKTGLYQLDNTFDTMKVVQHFFLKTNSENDWESVSANVSQQEQIHWTCSQNEKILPLLLSPFVCSNSLLMLKMGHGVVSKIVQVFKCHTMIGDKLVKQIASSFQCQ